MCIWPSTMYFQCIFLWNLLTTCRESRLDAEPGVSDCDSSVELCAATRRVRSEWPVGWNGSQKESGNASLCLRVRSEPALRENLKEFASKIQLFRNCYCCVLLCFSEKSRPCGCSWVSSSAGNENRFVPFKSIMLHWCTAPKWVMWKIWKRWLWQRPGQPDMKEKDHLLV